MGRGMSKAKVSSYRYTITSSHNSLEKEPFADGGWRTRGCVFTPYGVVEVDSVVSGSLFSGEDTSQTWYSFVVNGVKCNLVEQGKSRTRRGIAIMAGKYLWRELHRDK